VKKIKSTYGRTMTEVIIVMVLLILFSVSALTLVATGSDSYVNIINKNETNSNLRVAQSYIHTKLRQNFERNAVYLKKFPDVDGNCLVIKDGYSNVSYETVIFLHEGQIKESLLIDGVDFNPEESFPIIEVDSLEFKIMDDGRLFFETVINQNGNTDKLSSYFNLLTR